MRTLILLLLTISLYSAELDSIKLSSDTILNIHQWYDVASGKRFLIFQVGNKIEVVEATPTTPIITKLPDLESTVPVPETSRTYGPVPPGWFLVRTEGPVKIVQRLPMSANSVLTSPK